MTTAIQYKIGLGVAEINNLTEKNFEEKDLEESFNNLGLRWQKIENPRENIISLARENMGKPYKYGASVSKDAPNCFDCSSFTSWLYISSGIAIPRISIDQYLYGEKVDLEDAKPGDLVFSNTHKNIRNVFHTESKEFRPGTKIEKAIDHCGIFAGDTVIHTTDGRGVIEENIDESYSFEDIVGIRRINGVDEVRFVVFVQLERSNIKTKEDLLKEILG